MSLKGHVDAARVLLDAGAAVDKRRARGIGRRLGLRAPLGTSIWRRYWWSEDASIDLCLAERHALYCLPERESRRDGAVVAGLGADVNWANEEGGTILYGSV